MKKIFESWLGVTFNYLISDDLISFYAFFTTIFAECAYLWAFQPKQIACVFTVLLLLNIVNVLVFAGLKGWYEGCKQEVAVARWYVVCFVIIFIIGCFINFWLNLILVAIAFCVTFLWINIRGYQDTCYVGFDGIVGALGNLFNNKVFWTISQIIVLGAPYVVFTWMLALIPGFPIFLKVIIPILYFIFAPFIALIEDEMVAQNIFEIAYDIWYDEKNENIRK